MKIVFLLLLATVAVSADLLSEDRWGGGHHHYGGRHHGGRYHGRYNNWNQQQWRWSQLRNSFQNVVARLSSTTQNFLEQLFGTNVNNLFDSLANNAESELQIPLAELATNLVNIAAAYASDTNNFVQDSATQYWTSLADILDGLDCNNVQDRTWYRRRSWWRPRRRRSIPQSVINDFQRIRNDLFAFGKCLQVQEVPETDQQNLTNLALGILRELNRFLASGFRRGSLANLRNNLQQLLDQLAQLRNQATTTTTEATTTTTEATTTTTEATTTTTEATTTTTEATTTTTEATTTTTEPTTTTTEATTTTTEATTTTTEPTTTTTEATTTTTEATTTTTEPTTTTTEATTTTTEATTTTTEPTTTTTEATTTTTEATTTTTEATTTTTEATTTTTAATVLCPTASRTVSLSQFGPTFNIASSSAGISINNGQFILACPAPGESVSAAGFTLTLNTEGVLTVTGNGQNFTLP